MQKNLVSPGFGRSKTGLSMRIFLFILRYDVIVVKIAANLDSMQATSGITASQIRSKIEKQLVSEMSYVLVRFSL